MMLVRPGSVAPRHIPLGLGCWVLPLRFPASIRPSLIPM